MHLTYKNLLFHFSWIKQINTKKVYHIDNICYAVMYLVKRFDKEVYEKSQVDSYWQKKANVRDGNFLY